MSERKHLFGGMIIVGNRFKRVTQPSNKAANLIAWAATRTRCHYVIKKWLNYMLTNWYTTKTRLHKFKSLKTE
ncbi:hypothetical protein HN51_007281 [Arachis hypogaea]